MTRVVPWLHWVFKWLNRGVLSSGVGWRFDEASLSRWQNIPTGSGVMLAVKHADFTDHFAVYEMACRINKRCLFVSIPEAFAICGGLGGVVISGLGAIAFERGGANMQASRFIINALAQTDQPVVIFPEGELHFLNDEVTPLKAGVSLFALEAERLRKEKKGSSSVFIVPISLKYVYPANIGPLLESKLQGLEKRAFGKFKTGDFMERLYALLNRVFAMMCERSGCAGIVTESGSRGIEERFADLAKTLIEGLEGAPGERTGTLSDRARRLKVKHKGDSRKVEAALLAIHCLDFLPGYLAHPTQERIMETLRKTERLLTGNETPGFPGKKLLLARVEPPIAVSGYYEEFANRKTKSAAVNRLSLDLRHALQSGVAALCEIPDAKAPALSGRFQQ